MWWDRAWGWPGLPGAWGHGSFVQQVPAGRERQGRSWWIPWFSARDPWEAGGFGCTGVSVPVPVWGLELSTSLQPLSPCTCSSQGCATSPPCSCFPVAAFPSAISGSAASATGAGHGECGRSQRKGFSRASALRLDGVGLLPHVRGSLWAVGWERRPPHTASQGPGMVGTQSVLPHRAEEAIPRRTGHAVLPGDSKPGWIPREPRAHVPWWVLIAPVCGATDTVLGQTRAWGRGHACQGRGTPAVATRVPREGAWQGWEAQSSLGTHSGAEL